MISLQHTSGRFGACNASVPKTSLYAHRHQFSGQNLGPQFCRGLLVQKSWRIHAEKPKGVKSNDDDDNEEDDALLPEEDWTVKGGYQDSLSKNTELGKAVDEAVAELDTLGNLEREQLEKANDLLKKLGFKQDINKDSGRPDSNPGNKNGTG